MQGLNVFGPLEDVVVVPHLYLVVQNQLKGGRPNFDLCYLEQKQPRRRQEPFLLLSPTTIAKLIQCPKASKSVVQKKLQLPILLSSTTLQIFFSDKLAKICIFRASKTLPGTRERCWWKVLLQVLHTNGLPLSLLIFLYFLCVPETLLRPWKTRDRESIWALSCPPQ